MSDTTIQSQGTGGLDPKGGKPPTDEELSFVGVLKTVTNAMRAGRKTSSTESEEATEAALTQDASKIIQGLLSGGVALRSEALKTGQSNQPGLIPPGETTNIAEVKSEIAKWFGPSYMALMLSMVFLLQKAQREAKMVGGMNKAELIMKSMEVTIETAKLAQEIKHTEAEKLVTDAIVSGISAAQSAGSIAATAGGMAANKAKSAASKGVSKAKAGAKYARNGNHNAKKYEAARNKVDNLENNDPRASQTHPQHNKWKAEHKKATADMKRYEPGIKQVGAAKAHASAQANDNDGYDAKRHTEAKKRQDKYNADKNTVSKAEEMGTTGDPIQVGEDQHARPMKEKNADGIPVGADGNETTYGGESYSDIKNRRNDNSEKAEANEAKIEGQKEKVAAANKAVEKTEVGTDERQRAEGKLADEETELKNLEADQADLNNKVMDDNGKLAIIGDEEDVATHENKLQSEIAGTEPGIKQISNYKNSHAYQEYKKERLERVGIGEKETEAEMDNFEKGKKEKLATTEKHYNDLAQTKGQEYKQKLSQINQESMQDYQQNQQMLQMMNQNIFGQGGNGGIIGGAVGMWANLRKAELTEEIGTLENLKTVNEGRAQIMRQLIESYGEDVRAASEFISRLIDGWSKEASAHNQAFGFQQPR